MDFNEALLELEKKRDEKAANLGYSEAKRDYLIAQGRRKFELFSHKE